MQMKRRFAQAAAVLLAGVLLYAFGVWENGRQEQFTGEKGKRLYPTKTEARERANEEPVFCVPVREAYTPKEETGIAEGLLAELQEYVARGKTSEAIEAYCDETLLLSVEELLNLCPEYESLIAQAGLRDSSIIENEDVWEDIVRIYQLPINGEDGDTLLVQYDGYGGSAGYWVFLKKAEETYQVGLVCIGVRVKKRQVKERESIIFTWSEGEESGCYLLERSDKGELFVERLVLCEDWKEEMEEGSWLLFDGDGRYIRRETTRAVSGFYYLNRRSSLLPAVKKYVEENMACFADKLYGWDGIVWRDLTIWGDEEPAELTGEEEKQIEEVLGERIYVRDIVCADYDNDGDLELFYREKEDVRLLFWENGICQAHPVILNGKEAAEQMWFVEFEGKTVTFEIGLPYREKYPLLSAYLIEGEQKTLLLSCQLIYGDTVEIDRSYLGARESFEYRDIYGFCPMVPLAEKQTLDWEGLSTKLEEACGEVRVVSVWEEAQPFSESFLSFIRECYGEVLAGRRAGFSRCLEPYAVDEKDDREIYLQLAGVEEESLAYLYSWAYRFSTPDGAEHFLVERDCGGTIGVCTLEWFRVEEEGLQYVDALVDYYRGDDSRIVVFEGQLYCIVTDYDFGTKNLQGVHILPLNDMGEWEHYYLSLTPDVENYQIVCLYDGAEAALSDYVQGVYKEVLTADTEQKIFTGTGENGEITDEMRRNIKNKDIYVFWSTVPYRVVDADNDGEWEVIRTEYFDPSSYHQSRYIKYGMYGYRDGAFVEFNMQDILNNNKNYTLATDNRFYRVSGYPLQLWFEEIDGVTYLFTLDLLSPTCNYLLHAYLIQGENAQDAGVWLLHAAMLENIEKAVYVDYLRG